MAFACTLCLASQGLKGTDIDSLPQTYEELYDHLERDHHIPVRRENETRQQCLDRFRKQNPEAGGPNCKCPVCSS